jgi:hypothetical protein
LKKALVTTCLIAIVLMTGGFSCQKKKLAGSVPTFCPAPRTSKCPGPGDADANGCPAGGYKSDTGECIVTFAYYKEYGGCKDDHSPMKFYTKASPGNPSKYHLVSASVFDIQAAFTQINCDSHVPVGAVNEGKPFLINPNDKFSDFKPEHTSDDASPEAKDKCFKVTINPSVGDCIDPHIIISGN